MRNSLVVGGSFCSANGNGSGVIPDSRNLRNWFLSIPDAMGAFSTLSFQRKEAKGRKKAQRMKRGEGEVGRYSVSAVGNVVSAISGLTREAENTLFRTCLKPEASARDLTSVLAYASGYFGMCHFQPHR